MVTVARGAAQSNAGKRHEIADDDRPLRDPAVDQTRSGIRQGREGIREVASPPLAPATLDSAAASTFEMRGVQWFWPNRFALGKLGLICGLPDRGKGLIISYMIAKATTGGDWPCNEGNATQGKVLLLTAEDDPGDTIVPRLVAAGADCKHVHIISMVRQGENRRMFSLVSDLALLRQKIDAIGNVVLIVIDPMSAYLGVGKVDSYRAADVRGVLSPLTELAAEKKIAIVAVMHFSKKADVSNAMLRVADSLAFVAAARHCYVVVDDAESNRRLFVKAKNNLAPDMAGLSYTIDTKTVGTDPKTDELIGAPFVVWGREHVNVTATAAMQAEDNGTSAGPRDIAKKFLANTLACGPLPKIDIIEAADANLISKRTLERAKSDLGVIAKKSGLKGGWIWQMPEQKSWSAAD